MYKNILQNMANIEVWPLISLGIFFLFFVFLLWWVFTADKKHIAYMSDLPLQDADPNKITNRKSTPV